MRAAFYTLGCKVNQYESHILMQLFAADGFEIVDPQEVADVYVVNSCTVTATSDQKTRQILRRLRRQNPAAVVALTGCFAQAFPEAAGAIPEADVVTGARERASLLAAVRQVLAGGGRVVAVAPHQKGEPFEPMASVGQFERTRAILKIQDGCERYCAYCIIPTARGPSRSKPLPDLAAELAALQKAGYQEVVLAGINLSCYGQEQGLRLLDAVRLACESGIPRVRLGSLEPELLTEEDVAAMSRLPALCDQFHLSLQSGCDATLRRMNRHYTAGEYLAIVKRLRRYFPGCAITTDVMVGFPGETDEEFAASVAFVRQVGFAKAHVFAYSPRPGTRAAAMQGQLTRAVKEQRSAHMQQAAQEGRRAFLAAQVGRVLPVLLESDREGHTPNYAPVRLDRPGRSGEILATKITGVQGDSCTGSAIETETKLAGECESGSL